MLRAKSNVLSLGGGFFSGEDAVREEQRPLSGGDSSQFSFDKDVKPSELIDLAELLQDGAVKVVVDSVHELRDADEAHRAIETHHAAGK
ncbi:hypothetical protein T484DRAFT_1781208, partial [Baffinella frigidus]